MPEGVGAKQLDVRITRQHLSVGIKGLPPYLDVRKQPVPVLALGGRVFACAAA